MRQTTNVGRKEQSMLKAKLAVIIGIWTRHAWSVIALAALLAVVSGIYASRHFAIDTDINRLISPDLPWRQQELAFSRAFPQRNGTIFAVVDAPTAELASELARRSPRDCRGKKICSGAWMRLTGIQAKRIAQVASDVEAALKSRRGASRCGHVRFWDRFALPKAFPDGSSASSSIRDSKTFTGGGGRSPFLGPRLTEHVDGRASGTRSTLLA
jgi:hypothetical protein